MGIWQMNAFNGVVEAGAEGATLFAPWSQVNPASGQYNWGSLDRQIAMHAEAGRLAIRNMAGARLEAIAIESGEWTDELLAEAGELGAPLTKAFTYAGFACRGFCHGIAARCVADGTRSIISWGGELL